LPQSDAARHHQKRITFSNLSLYYNSDEKRACMKKYLFPVILGIGFSVSLGQGWVRTNGPWNGTIEALAISEGKIFAGTFASGIFLSTDNAELWSAINSGLPNVTCSSFRLLAAAPGAILAGTANHGIFRSTDNGASWTSAASGLPQASIQALVACEGEFLAGTAAGVFRSTDNGAGWEAVNDGLLSSEVSSFAVSGSRVIAGTRKGIALLSPVDGKSWIMAANTGLPANSCIVSLAAGGGAIFAGTKSSGIFLSGDSGATWREVNNGLLYKSRDSLGTINYIPALAISGSRVFAGTYDNGVFMSTTSGGNWIAVNSGINNLHITALMMDGDAIIAGTRGGGVYRSDDNGEHWTPKSAGISYASVHSLVVHGGSVFAGTYHDVYRSDNEGKSWGNSILGGALALVSDGSDLFAGTPGYGLFHSTSNGATWEEIGFGISGSSGNTTFEGSYVTSLLVSGGTIFAGGYGVYRSDNKGNTWTKADSGIDDKAISSLTMTGNALIAGTVSGGIFVSGNNAESWSRAPLKGDSTFQSLVFAMGGGNVFASTGKGNFLSTDNGKSWAQADPSYPSICCLATKGDSLFAGSSDGSVFLSTTQGLYWAEVDTGLEGIQSLAASGSSIYAGIGSGCVWRKPIAELAGVIDRKVRKNVAPQAYFTVASSSAQYRAIAVTFTLPRSGRTAVAVYDLSGKKTASLVDRELPAGSYSFQWNARNAAPGCYVIRARLGSKDYMRSVPFFR
jgi:hypothetical protein